MQDSQFTPEQLDELIRRTYVRLIELDEEISRAKNPRARTRLYDAVSKMGALLMKLLKQRGVKFEEGESLAELLSRLAQQKEKDVEETVKRLVDDLFEHKQAD